MKSLSRHLVLSSILLFTTSIFASQGGSNGSTDDDSLSTIKTYLLNLGQYLGYNIDQSPQTEDNPVSDTLMQVTTQALTATLLPAFQSLWGALPVNTAGLNMLSGTVNPIFVPANVQTYSQLNAAANSTFMSSQFYTPSSGISVSTLIDQPNVGATTTSQGQQYQSDPVSQAVANILTTPDYSYCLDNAGANFIQQCNYPSGLKNEAQIMQNVIGALPNPVTFFTPQFNQNVIPQLNSNSLIAPLMYSSTSLGTDQTQSGSNFVNTATIGAPSGTTPSGPLQAQTQAQQALNFIRYATSAVAPLALPSYNDYGNLYLQIIDTTNKYTAVQKWQAASTIANYLANLRVYAAQASVGIGNLYYILSKRMPQPIQGTQTTESTTTSQALSEYNMATWRLFNPTTASQTQGQPGQPTTTQWITNLNQASAATIQKEIAILLAEINYQLYLNRQQEERLLLTNSMLLLQNARASQPTGALAATGQASASTSTTAAGTQ
ncbi:intracellular multiplication protein IcmX [Legionella lansingensis]|uniref:Intracellular multiplication protein IcmX n=1 Tax=Legionella lansingensis TaxID=45067 RepID=A0A0W0VPB1_9GAMM|nr:type IVB secretion system protein IcmX [Legionella lansingensis]KTD22016.1 intracellular multiplication protein IcmX [Legionella lansingensis]SNV53991.1 intracellular multiplication protein IcmX [Legionella lansingensis]